MSLHKGKILYEFHLNIFLSCGNYFSGLLIFLKLLNYNRWCSSSRKNHLYVPGVKELISKTLNLFAVRLRSKRRKISSLWHFKEFWFGFWFFFYWKGICKGVQQEICVAERSVWHAVCVRRKGEGGTEVNAWFILEQLCYSKAR